MQSESGLSISLLASRENIVNMVKPTKKRIAWLVALKLQSRNIVGYVT